MIGVQQRQLLLRQQAQLQRRPVKGNHGQRLEVQEAAILVLAVPLHQLQILMADAELSGGIVAGFIGYHHALCQRRDLLVLRQPPVEPLRPLMDAEHIPHAVTGAVVVVHPLLPQRQPGQNIQILPAQALREPGRSQPQMTLQHHRIGPAFLLRQRPQRDGTGDVRGSLQIVSAGIRQTEAAGLQRHIRLRRRLIVDDGSVGAEGHDGVKAWPQIVRLLSPEALQLGGSAALGDGFLAHMALQPADEPAHRHTVLDVGGPEVLLLCRGLHGLHQLHRAGSVQHLGPGQALQYAVVGRGAVRLHRRPCRDGPQPVINALIGGQRHAAGHQLLLQFSGQDLLLHTQGGLLLPQQQEGQEHRRAAHVVAPEVQRPRHLVQRRQHQYLCPGLPHLLPQQMQLLLTGQPGALRRQLPHRLRRQRRPVRPHGPGQILLIGEADVLPLQRSGHRPGKKTADGASVKAHGASLRHPLCQKSPDGGNAGLPRPHQVDGAPGQLIRRLQKVPPVRPQGGAVRQHHQRTGRAGEARQVLPCLKIVTHVLRAVEIIRYHHIGVHALLLHPLPQQSELFSAVHCDYRLSFIS